MFVVLVLFVLLSEALLACNPPGYKVYVYDVAASLSLNSEKAREERNFHVCKKCIYEQFSLEYVIHGE